ncbi:MAG: DNA-directed RNA polymerase subunit alpha C-terminal domain-containing protein [Mariprofundaceae bacterium]
MARNLELFASAPLEHLVKVHPGALLRVNEIQIALRSQKALISEGIQYVGDLIHETEERLLKIPNFGRKSLKEIIDVLGYINLRLGIQLPSWPPNDIELLRKKYSKKVVEQKKNLYAHTHKISAFCLEEELFNVANQIGERNAQIFIQRMGWDGNGGKTLDAVGKKYGMTRERIRQICAKIEKKLQRHFLQTDFLKQGIECLHSNLPNIALEAEKLLASKGISQNPFRIEGVITAARLLGLEAQFCIEKFGRKKTRIIVHESSKGAPKHIVIQARKHIEHWGAGTIADVTCTVNSTYKTSASDALTGFILESLEDFRWLDQDSGWFWLTNNKRNRITNLIRKIVSVANKLSISDLRSGIMRPHRMRGYSPPKRVLREICKQSSEYKVEDDIVFASPPLKWEDVLEDTNAFVLVKVLSKFGPVLARSDFESRCMKEGMNRTSFYMYLGSSPLIQRFSRGVYGLRGAGVSIATIEQLRKKVETEGHTRALAIDKHRVLVDYGWTSKGKIWVSYKISESSVFSGVMSTPGKMRQYLDGEFDLYSADKEPVGKLCASQGKTWGLGPFFRRRGCEPGDFMIVLYDLKTRLAVAEIGDEDLIDRFTA